MGAKLTPPTSLNDAKNMVKRLLHRESGSVCVLYQRVPMSLEAQKNVTILGSTEERVAFCWQRVTGTTTKQCSEWVVLQIPRGVFDTIPRRIGCYTDDVSEDGLYSINVDRAELGESVVQAPLITVSTLMGTRIQHNPFCSDILTWANRRGQLCVRDPRYSIGLIEARKHVKTTPYHFDEVVGLPEHVLKDLGFKPNAIEALVALKNHREKQPFKRAG